MQILGLLLKRYKWVSMIPTNHIAINIKNTLAAAMDTKWFAAMMTIILNQCRFTEVRKVHARDAKRGTVLPKDHYYQMQEAIEDERQGRAAF